MAEILGFLLKHPHLKRLELKDTEIRDRASNQLIFSLKENTVLEEIDLRQNLLNPRNLTQIQKALRRNRNAHLQSQMPKNIKEAKFLVETTANKEEVISGIKEAKAKKEKVQRAFADVDKRYETMQKEEGAKYATVREEALNWQRMAKNLQEHEYEIEKDEEVKLVLLNSVRRRKGISRKKSLIRGWK